MSRLPPILPPSTGSYHAYSSPKLPPHPLGTSSPTGSPRPFLSHHLPGTLSPYRDSAARFAQLGSPRISSLSRDTTSALHNSYPTSASRPTSPSPNSAGSRSPSPSSSSSGRSRSSRSSSRKRARPSDHEADHEEPRSGGHNALQIIVKRTRSDGHTSDTHIEESSKRTTYHRSLLDTKTVLESGLGRARRFQAASAAVPFGSFAIGSERASKVRRRAAREGSLRASSSAGPEPGPALVRLCNPRPVRPASPFAVRARPTSRGQRFSGGGIEVAPKAPSTSWTVAAQDEVGAAAALGERASVRRSRLGKPGDGLVRRFARSAHDRGGL
ncbi:hypothetical protein ACQY0O_001764 [Thecaphora frezii]